ncbi:MAG TPA: carboxymuconolactone decarboxylase family protein [Acidimicrobiales bacterium]|nr:carboxymuconolactone decarboxylase family protein [Acidimicrobiales bacterium]
MSPRLPPVPVQEWPPAMRGALAAMAPPNPRHPVPERRDDRPKGRNLLGLFAHHPELTRAYNTFNGHLLFATTLTPRQRELLVLRVGVLRDAEYEWLQHKVIATDLGMTAEEIDRVTEGPDADGWTPLDAALLRAVDELVADARIGEETWAALAVELDAQQLLDLVFTVGAYDVLAMAMRTFGVEVDEDLARWK